MIVVEELVTIAELEAIRDEWTQLWERCPSATPFQHPAWLLPWCRVFALAPLFVLAVRDGRRLVGLAPLSLALHDGKEVVTLLGDGVSDYLDAIFEPGAADDGMRAVLGFLEAERSRWDFCSFDRLRPGSPLLEAPLPPGWIESREVQEVCLVLSPPRDALSSSRLLRYAKHCRRRAERLGRVSLEVAAGRDLGACIETLRELHGARWRARGEPGVFGRPIVRRFHAEAAPELAAAGLLRVHVLRIADRCVAAYYELFAHRRAYLYVGGFDLAFARLSPGTLVLGVVIEGAIEAGAEEIDFLRGRNSHKYAWGAQDRATFRRRIWPGQNVTVIPSLGRDV